MCLWGGIISFIPLAKVTRSNNFPILQVGDFVFLSLRTRSSNLNVLNRERTPRYRLEIRAKVRRRDGGKRVRMKEPKCVVDVEVSYGQSPSL